MDGLPALDLWDVVIEVLRSPNNTNTRSDPVPGNTDQHSRYASRVNPKGQTDIP